MHCSSSTVIAELLSSPSTVPPGCRYLSTCMVKQGLKIRIKKKMCLQVNASTIDGVTPLFNACTVGSVACTEILLENGAQPQSLVYHPSPIHEATCKGILR